MAVDRQRIYGLDLVVASLTFVVSCGFFLDAWAHGHVPIESFFTPYHGVFYSALLILVAVLGTFGVMRLNAGYPLRFAFPDSYHWPLLGIPIFLLSGVGDLTWHHFFGVEEGVDALLSPTHQGLGLGMFFLSGAPIISTLRCGVTSNSRRRRWPWPI